VQTWARTLAEDVPSAASLYLSSLRWCGGDVAHPSHHERPARVQPLALPSSKSGQAIFCLASLTRRLARQSQKVLVD
jgi:hypothetical protein